ncbi:helix-turn-helix domain-containing protein [Enterobacter mori]|uniref:Inhibitor of hydrogen peroxide resistance n=1 Tax=Enterobacter mori TaxID=539813 RepID=A0A7T0H138_9ENTR|nr:helix-turn-helix domain-containing protein [Enterobacter mori]QPK01463.1 helix-turn-helix domain-containing protein [Enterobacter mori]
MNADAKPLSELGRLEQCLKASGTPFKIPQQQIIFGNRAGDGHDTFFLQTGVAAVYRQSDELLIGIVNAPFIFGLSSGMIERRHEYTIVAQTPCAGFYLPGTTTSHLIQQEYLWREAFCWLSWINRVLEKRDMQLVGNNSYQQIRAMLLNMAEWDETLRSKIGVMNHIQQSTRISRSVVAEILAALRQGNYINMSRGKLVSINRLPTEY